MDIINYLKTIEWTAMNMAKAVLIGLAALVVATFALKIISATFQPLVHRFGADPDMMVAPMMGGAGYGGSVAYDMAASEESAYGYGKYDDMAQLSMRNVASTRAMPPTMPGSPVGNTAEDFEVTSYNASIETADKAGACGVVAELKKHKYVIFESANDHDTGCDYSFKVERDRVSGVLAVIEGLNPKELSESTYTIKRQVDDFTSEEEVLTKKRESIDQTLARAMSAYDEVTILATRSQNAEALASIINSKIAIIERLTQERININEQLDRLTRAKEDQLDSLLYTHFYVNIYENKYLDVKTIGESWKHAIRQFVHDLNQVAQDITINLVALIFLVAQYALYLLILLVVVKYGWRIGRRIWEM